jgi:hypothetical protein
MEVAALDAAAGVPLSAVAERPSSAAEKPRVAEEPDAAAPAVLRLAEPPVGALDVVAADSLSAAEQPRVAEEPDVAALAELRPAVRTDLAVMAARLEEAPGAAVAESLSAAE